MCEDVGAGASGCAPGTWTGKRVLPAIERRGPSHHSRASAKMGREGIEPSRTISPADFKSAASAVSPPPHMQTADSIRGHQPSSGGDGRDRTDDRDFADPCLNHLATSPCERERKTGFEPVTLCLASRCSTTEPLPLVCRGPELNWGHLDFQSSALPTELPRPAPSEHAYSIRCRACCQNRVRACLSSQRCPVLSVSCSPMTLSLTRHRASPWVVRLLARRWHWQRRRDS